MEYQSNNNSAVITASNGTANSNTSNTASGSENRKPATAQQLVRENVQYLIEQLEAGHSETLAAFLRAMAIFREYSFGNSMAIARQHPSATHVAGMYAWNQLGRFVNKGEKGIAILAPVIGKRSKHAQDTNAEDADADKPAVLGFRRVYVWDRLSRDLRPCTACHHVPPRGGASGVLLNGSSHIIAQFTGALQGGLNANEFQFAGGDLSGWFVVSLCCV